MARFSIIVGGRVADHAEAEPDYAAQQGWVPALDSRIGDLWDGEVFVPAPTPAPTPVVPPSVTMRQARLALLGAGLLANVDAAINALPSPQKEAARIEWEYSKEVQRHSGFVSVLAPLLGLTDAQTDALFLVAEGL